MEFHSFAYILLLTVKTDKMELMIGINLINDEHSIPIVVTSHMTVKFFVKGYHVYKDLWKLFTNEELTTGMEPDNVVYKYAVCVKKNNVIVGHLPLGKNGRFAKMIFYFLRTDRYAEYKVIITGKEANLGDGEGMQVPYLLKISVTKNMLQILRKIFKINRYRKIIPFLPVIQPTVRCFEFCKTQWFCEFQGFLFCYDAIYRYFWLLFPTNQLYIALSTFS